MQRTRRANQVIRRVDPWSVLRFSLVFYVCIFVIVLTASVLLWMAAVSLGIVHNVEKFIGDILALDNFHFRAWQMLRIASLGGLVLVVVGSAVNLLGALLFNLISDVVGGIRVTVEEDRTPHSVV